MSTSTPKGSSPAAGGVSFLVGADPDTRETDEVRELLLINGVNTRMASTTNPTLLRSDPAAKNSEIRLPKFAQFISR